MNSIRKNIWILGGTGFIGTALIKTLAENKENQLQVLMHKKTPFKSLESFNTFSSGLENFDYSWFSLYPPDVIFHLARIGGSRTITRRIASLKGAKANREFIDQLNQLPKKPILIYVSGSLMYGNSNQNEAFDEFTAMNPIAYAKHYITAEIPFLKAQKESLTDIRFARPGWIIGPSSWFKVFYWNHFIQYGEIPLFGIGKQLMSLVSLDDCAGQIATFAKEGEACCDLNIFTGKPIRQEEFAIALGEKLNAGVVRISEDKLKMIYGKTVSEALLSTIPLTSVNNIAKTYKPIHGDLNAMLDYTIALLKHEQGIFAKTPERSFI